MPAANQPMFSHLKMPIQYFQFDVAGLASYHPEGSATNPKRVLVVSALAKRERCFAASEYRFFQRQQKTPLALAKRPTPGPVVSTFLESTREVTRWRN
jgi:hypothetical protein